MESTHCVVSADSTHARVFRLCRDTRSTGDEVARLEEIKSLVNPERRVRPSEALSDSRPGTRRGGTGTAGQGHGVDDHRGAHSAELERRFAREIAEATRAAVAELGSEQLIIAAPSKMIGLLRAEDLGSAAVTTATKELTNLSASELCSYLIKNQLIDA